MRNVYQWDRWYESYEFHIAAIFYNPETGLFHYSEDDGCSCPYPWEYHTEDDYGPGMTLKELRKKVIRDSKGEDATYREHLDKALEAARNYDPNEDDDDD